MDRVSISAPCTVEYARCMTPQSLTRRALPESWKLPADFFTYQIVQLDDRHQLLLTDVRASGVYGVQARLHSDCRR